MCLRVSRTGSSFVMFSLPEKTWFSLAMEHSTLFKECVVASSNTFTAELEDLFSDLSYVWYVTHTHTHMKNQPLASLI